MEIATLELANYLKELEYLVNIDSVSSDAAGTAKIAEFMADKYRALGWQVNRHHFNDTVGPCLEITNQAAKQFDVLILAHMDTVFPIGTAKGRPFFVQDGRAYGPGVIDCKAGLLSSFYALAALNQAGRLAGKAVCVFLNSDHEGISSKYSKSYTEQLARKSKCTLVLEGARANGDLVNKRKGIGRYFIEISGVEAHAGVDHHKGRNAIEELAHWVLALQGQTDYTKETTLNIGKISGGTSISSVPNYARAELDVRFYDQQEVIKIEQLMQELAAQPHVAGTTAKVTGGITRPAMVPSAKTEELSRAIDEIGRSLQVEFGWTASGGGSDGSFAAAVGSPTIDGLGPVGGGAHSAQEYLEIATVEPRYQLLCSIIAYVINWQR